MTEVWEDYFSTSYSANDVTDAARQLLSREVVAGSDPRLILLLDMFSEIACKSICDNSGPQDIKVMITSAKGHFEDQELTGTGQYQSFQMAEKNGQIEQDTIRALAAQSAAQSVISQVLEAGNDPTGMIIQSVPLGFDAHIDAATRKPGLATRLFGGRS